MWAKLDEIGRPIAFYDEVIHGKSLPVDAVDISDEAWREALANPGRRRVDDDGDMVECEPPQLRGLRREPKSVEELVQHVEARLAHDALLQVLVGLVSAETRIDRSEVVLRVAQAMGGF